MDIKLKLKDFLNDKKINENTLPEENGNNDVTPTAEFDEATFEQERISISSKLSSLEEEIDKFNRKYFPDDIRSMHAGFFKHRYYDFLQELGYITRIFDTDMIKDIYLRTSKNKH